MEIMGLDREANVEVPSTCILSDSHQREAQLVARISRAYEKTALLLTGFISSYRFLFSNVSLKSNFQIMASKLMIKQVMLQGAATLWLTSHYHSVSSSLQSDLMWMSELWRRWRNVQARTEGTVSVWTNICVNPSSWDRKTVFYSIWGKHWPAGGS